MARIDSLLDTLVREGANELRLGTDREPAMFAYGTPKKLEHPRTSLQALRDLLGDLLTPERERELTRTGTLETFYDSPSLGRYRLLFGGRAGGFDVVVVRVGARATGGRPLRPPAEPEPAVAAPPPAPVVPPPPVAPAVVEARVPPARVRDERPAAPAAARARLDELLSLAAAGHASDVHLVDGGLPCARTDGQLRPLSDEPVSSVEALLGPLFDEAMRTRLASGVSCDRGFDLADRSRCRLNVYRTVAGLAASIRLLPEAVPALSSLQTPLPLDDLVLLPHGLVLVCGPTGCGKSTTLAALAEECLRRRPAVVVTLEDPIEYALGAGPRARSGIVRQRQVGRDVRDFATGLRDALREDPDVLLIGEMRDPETISLALTAAETGHLVLASLHSRSAVSAVERIVDAYPPERQGQIRVQLADALRAVIAQRLLPRARGGGRVLAMEVLRATNSVANLVREGKTEQLASAIQAGRKEGMLPLERALADLVLKGVVSKEDARGQANDPQALASYLAG